MRYLVSLLTATPSVPPLLRMVEQASFTISVNLDDSGVVEGQLAALYSRSELITTRFPLPFSLEAEPSQGVVRVVKSGDGLMEGDVLRACSTLEFRYDSTRRETLLGAGFRGRRPRTASSAARPADDAWWQRLWNQAGAELGGFTQQLPTRVLFVADGRPYVQVTDALVANQVDKSVNEIVMLFERPLVDERAMGEAPLLDTAAARGEASFVPRDDDQASLDPGEAADDVAAILGTLSQFAEDDEGYEERGNSKRRRRPRRGS